MHILVTTDSISGNHYYSKFAGLVSEIKDNQDPAKKFKSIKLEGGGQSVTTELFKSFGTSKSMNFVFERLNNTWVAPKKDKSIEIVEETAPVSKNKIVAAIQAEMVVEPVTVFEGVDAISEPVEEPVTPPAKKGRSKSSTKVEVADGVEVTPVDDSGDVSPE